MRFQQTFTVLALVALSGCATFTGRSPGPDPGPCALTEAESPCCPRETPCVPDFQQWRSEIESQSAALQRRIESLESELDGSREQVETVTSQLKASREEVARLRKELAHWQGEVKRVRTEIVTQQQSDLASLDELSEILERLLSEQRNATGENQR
jgi:septal ring factor EnvC (AmiA/AmiB activator)